MKGTTPARNLYRHPKKVHRDTSLHYTHSHEPRSAVLKSFSRAPESPQQELGQVIETD